MPLTIQMNVPEKKYISLKELGEILKELAYCSPFDKTAKSVVKPRNVRKIHVETGRVNLFEVDEGNMIIVFT